jgi:hypothetical protein
MAIKLAVERLYQDNMKEIHQTTKAGKTKLACRLQLACCLYFIIHHPSPGFVYIHVGTALRKWQSSNLGLSASCICKKQRHYYLHARP